MRIPNAFRPSAASVSARCGLLAALAALVVGTSLAEEKPGDVALNQALKVLQMEGAPAAQGNTEEAVQMCEMLAMTARVAAASAAEGDEQVTAPLPDQRQYCHLDESGSRVVFLILRDDLDTLPDERRKFFLGMSVGMSQNIARRFEAIDDVAVGVVWDGEARWATIARLKDGEFENQHFDGADKALEGLRTFFSDTASE